MMAEDDMTSAAADFGERSQYLAAFTGIVKPKPTDKFFVVMGMTGSGKSTFISHCTGVSTGIGHGLRSFTQDIAVSRIERGRHSIYLADTPGFNDTERSDSATLQVIASYLGASYANGVRVNGIIIVHPMTDNRMTGASIRNIEMIKAVCGLTRYDNLAIATTKWPESCTPEERETLRLRAQELQADRRFFGEFVQRGACVFRHCEQGHGEAVRDRASAMRILDYLVSMSGRCSMPPLQLQLEIIRDNKHLNETEAGLSLLGVEMRMIRTEGARRLAELEQELKSDAARRNAAYTADLFRTRAITQARLDRLESDQRGLEMSMWELHQREAMLWRQNVGMVQQQLQAHVKAKEREVVDMERSLAAVRAHSARRRRRKREKAAKKTVDQTTTPARASSPSPPPPYRAVAPEDATPVVECSDDEECEKLVEKSRREARQAQETYDDVFEKNPGRREAINAAINGVAAGAVTGAISAGATLCSLM